jgi:hypothetical protein
MKRAKIFANSFNAFVCESKLSDAVHLFRISELSVTFETSTKCYETCYHLTTMGF